MELLNSITHHQYLFFFTIFLLSLQSLNSKNLEPQCDGSTIKYPVQVNLREYLDNENNIDNRTFYNPGTI